MMNDDGSNAAPLAKRSGNTPTVAGPSTTLGVSYGGLILSRISSKLYRCTTCGHEKMRATNHYGECYPVCEKCRRGTTHECIELLRLAREGEEDGKAKL